MKREKKTAFVAVITDLTEIQAANIQRELVVAKQRHSPGARASAVVVPVNEIGNHLQAAWTKCLERKD